MKCVRRMNCPLHYVIVLSTPTPKHISYIVKSENRELLLSMTQLSLNLHPQSQTIIFLGSH